MNLTIEEPTFPPINSPRPQADHEMMLPEKTNNVSIKNKNFRLAFLDLDDPGPFEQTQTESILDDDFSLSRLMKDTLKSSTEAAFQRDLKANSVFGRIISITHHECQALSLESSAANIKALKKVYEGLVSVIRRDFKAFVRGVTVGPTILSHEGLEMFTQSKST